MAGQAQGDVPAPLAALAAAASQLETAVGPLPYSPPSWEEQLQAVAAEVHSNSSGAGAAQPAPPPALGSYLQQVAEAITGAPVDNQVTFLPLGMGTRAVLGAVITEAVRAAPTKHVVLVVDRPAQALSHGDRLRRELGLDVGIFAGGDFLYQFPQELARCSVVVITAGLLLRLLKTGQYRFPRASLVIVRDAFTVIRNHPANTVVREYYWKAPADQPRPKLLGILTSHLHSKQRPFDKQRQHLRKLCQSMRASLVLPQGCALAEMEGRLHRDPIALRPFSPSPVEAGLMATLQQHCLTMWDILHEFSLNHFGKLLHFSMAPAPGTVAAEGSGVMDGSGSAVLAAESSSADAGQQQQPWEDCSDPLAHDWLQVETMLLHSIWHTDSLPNRGEHTRNPEALALMMHVLDCVRALRVGLELGTSDCLQLLAPALRGLHSFIVEGIGGPLGSSLKARILEVAGQSPLVQWVAQQGAAGLQAAAGGSGAAVSSRLAALIELLAGMACTAVLAQTELEDAVQQQQHQEPCRVAVIVGSQQAAAVLLSSLQAAPELVGARVQVLADGRNIDGGSSSTTPAAAQPAAAAGSLDASNSKSSDLQVLLLTQQQLACAAAELSNVASVVWYSAADVVSASSHDLDSLAFFACHQLCATAHSQRNSDGSRRRVECTVLASQGQVQAFWEAVKVDQTLKAAMQLVQQGDSLFEERLSKLAHPDTAGELQSDARLVLELLTAGLCGEAPVFSTTSEHAQPPSANSADACCSGRGHRHGHGHGHGHSHGHSHAAEPSSGLATTAPAGSAGSPVDCESSHSAGTHAPKHNLLFQCSVSLPEADFPAERFQPQAVCMPQTPFVGARLATAAAAENSAALLALQALHSLGIVVRYWPSRLLLAQHLLPQQQQQQQLAHEAVPAAQAIPAGQAAGNAASSQAMADSPSHFCNLCHVTATGGQAFNAHVKGFKHQRRLRQQAILQHGGEGCGSGYESPGEYPGSPSYPSPEAYSPEPTAYHCTTCGVYCSSQQLLETHFHGRKHQRRAAGLDDGYLSGQQQQQQADYGQSRGSSDGGGVGAHGSGQVPLPHQLPPHRFGQGRLPQQQMPLVSPFYCSVCSMWATSEEQLSIHMMGKRHSRMMALQQSRGSSGGGNRAGGVPLMPPPPYGVPHTIAVPAGVPPMMPLPPMYMGLPPPSVAGSGSGSMPGVPGGHAGASVAMSGGPRMQPEPSVGQQQQVQDRGRLPRCDLCNVVTPSQRHFSYHLQSERHQRRQQRARGGSPGGEVTGAPASAGASPGGSRSVSPRHRRRGSGGGSGDGWAVDGLEGCDGAGGEALVCRVCGIMATSELNLEDHYKGRRHQRNLQRLQQQGVPVLPAEAAWQGAGGEAAPPDGATTVATVSVGGLQRQGSGVTVTADGVLLGSTLISSGSLQKQPSGDIYADFPCVRVGDVLLPSSMDLRRFLDELQILDEGQEEAAGNSASTPVSSKQAASATALPPIAEHSADGSGDPVPSSSSGPGGGGLQRSLPLHNMLDAPGAEAASMSSAGGGNGLQRLSPSYGSKPLRHAANPPSSSGLSHQSHPQYAGPTSSGSSSDSNNARMHSQPTSPAAANGGAGSLGTHGGSRQGAGSAPNNPRPLSRFSPNVAQHAAAATAAANGAAMAWGPAAPSLVPLPADAAAYGLVPLPHGMYHPLQAAGMPGYAGQYAMAGPGGRAAHGMMPMQQAAAVQYAAAASAAATSAGMYGGGMAAVQQVQGYGGQGMGVQAGYYTSGSFGNNNGNNNGSRGQHQRK